MSVVAHVLEKSGIATSCISLIREHSAAMKPPRSLWVPFELGRPFGAPGQAAFQTRVLTALLALLERRDGPVILHDFAEEAPAATEEELNGQFCALPLPKPSADLDLVAAATQEATTLAEWHALRMAKPGARTITGATQYSARQLIDFLAALHRSETAIPAPGLSVAQTARLGAEELRHWCLEAAMEKPGGNQSAAAMTNWFWGETAIAQLIMAVRNQCLDSADAELRRVAKLALVPADQQHRLPAS